MKDAFWVCLRTSVQAEFQSSSVAGDEKAMKACAEKAADDWERFLLKRSKELKTGGTFVAIMVGRGDENESSVLGETFRAGARVMVGGFLQALQDLVQDGSITEQEASSVNCPAFARTEDELKAPFVDSDSPVRMAGLTLTNIQPFCVPCPNEPKYLNGSLSKDAYAKRTAQSMRTWSYHLVYDALSAKQIGGGETTVE